MSDNKLQRYCAIQCDLITDKPDRVIYTFADSEKNAAVLLGVEIAQVYPLEYVCQFTTAEIQEVLNSIE